MTYSLKGGEIVEARVASSPQEIAVAKLRWLGVQVFRARDGGVAGQIAVEPAQLEALEGVRVDRLQRFRVVQEEHLQILAPSPLSRARPVPFLDAQSHEDLVARVARAWAIAVGQARRVLDTARDLARDAHLLMDPWRVEGTVQFGNDEVRVLFSSGGDRACVCGLNGRALVVQPLNPRIIIPVRDESSREERDGLWRAAIEQARTCLGAQPEPTKDEMSLSIDLASQDLELSYPEHGATPEYSGPPGMARPGQVAAPPVITGVLERPPPRMPPPRPRAAPAVGPPMSTERPSDSLDLASLDLSEDLGTYDLPD